jgi:hypothetical protein
MSLFQKMLLGKYTRPWKDENQSTTHSHHVITEPVQKAGNDPGLGAWLAQKLPAQALREFGSVTYEPRSIVSSDAVCLLQADLEDGHQSLTEEGEDSWTAPLFDEACTGACRKRYRSEEEQWQLETRIDRLKTGNRKTV